MADIVTLDQLLSHLNMDTPSDAVEMGLFIGAATAHVEFRYGTLPTGSYTETLTATTGTTGGTGYRLTPHRFPVSAVESITDGYGNEYTTDFTISSDGRDIRHGYLGAGSWTVAYTTLEPIPDDLVIAVLEDIRGLYQPGQIGPPSDFGAFGIDDEPARAFRPVNQWPRIDAWIDARLGPAIA